MIFSLNKRIQLFSKIITNTYATNRLHEALSVDDSINMLTRLLIDFNKKEGRIYLIGNGGSAAIASHAVIDLLNNANMSASTLHESSTVTCISNDYGYEFVYEQQIKKIIRNNDVLIAISSSGKSKNILNSVNAARIRDAKVITFSGFSADNPLRQMGDINFWLDSFDYGFVEIGHAFILHNITDRLHSLSTNKFNMKEEVTL